MTQLIELTPRRLCAIAAGIVALRVAVGLAVGKVALNVFSLSPSWPHPSHVKGAPDSLAVAMNRWDADLIAHVSRDGYQASDISMTTFFPVYPLLVKAAHTLGLPYEWASVVISTLAFFIATWGVLTLAHKLFPKRNPLFVGLLFAWCPTSIFLFAGYTEATYSAFVAWFLVAVVDRRWFVAAVLAGVGSAARPEGALLGVTLFFWLAWNRQWVKACLYGAVAEVGLIAFSVYCYFHYNDFFAYFIAQDSWHREHTALFAPLVRTVHALFFSGKDWPNDALITTTLNVVMLIAATGVVGLLLWKARVDRCFQPLGIYAALTFFVVVSNAPHGDSTEAAIRVLMCVAPLFVMATYLQRRIITYSAIGAFGIAAVGFGLFFQLGYWFT